MKRLLILSLYILICYTLSGQSIDKIVLIKGKPIEDVKIYEIHEYQITYLKKGSLHDIMNDEIKYFTLDGIVYIKSDTSNLFIASIVYQTEPNDVATKQNKIIATASKVKTQKTDTTKYQNKKNSLSTNENQLDSDNILVQNTNSAKQKPSDNILYEMGKKDAKKYFKGDDSFIGAMFLGFIAFPGIFGAIAMLCIRPSRKKMLGKNKNKDLAQYAAYEEGFMSQAKETKLAMVGIGFSLGLFLLLLLFLV